MVYQILFYQFPGLAECGLALSCTADSDLAGSGLARYAPPKQSGRRRRRPSPSFPLTEALIFSRLRMPSAVYIEQFQLFVKAM